MTDRIDTAKEREKLINMDALSDRVESYLAALDAKDAEINRLREAASAVEEWWLREGMHESVGGAPAAIFQLRSALNPEGKK